MAVRRERVILELQDDFTSGMARAAAATAVLDKELNGLSGDAVRSSKATRSVERDVDSLGSTTRKSGVDIDKFSGRLEALASIAASVGPAIVPISAVALPAISGLTSALGFSTLALGSSALAFIGLGDAVKAVNKAALEPTTQNLEAAREAMDRLSPAARDLVRELETFRPVLAELSATSAAGLFPGVNKGLEGLKTALPEIERVVSALSTKAGEIAADIGGSIASGKWDEFLNFVATEGPAAMGKFASAAGNLAHGLAGLWMSTEPLNDDFLNWLDKATAKFDKWSNDLGESQGFHDFMDYLHEIGPEVGATLESLGNALVQVTQAVAPLGGPSLRIIQAFANAIAAIADSPVGTPLLGLISAMATLRLATTAYGKAIASGPVTQTRNLIAEMTQLRSTGTSTWAALSRQSKGFIGPLTQGQVAAGKLRGSLGGIGKSGLAIGGLALATSGLADNIGLSNTASLALAGTIAGPWGAAIGGGIGALKDLSNAFDDSSERAGKYQRHLEDIVTLAGSDLKAQLAALKADAATLGDPRPDFIKNASSGGNPSPQLKQNLDLQKQVQRQIDLSALATQHATAATQIWAKAASDSLGVWQQQRAAARQTAGQFLAFGQSLDDSKVSLHDWITELAKQAQALEQFGQNAKTAADRGLRQGLIKALEEAGPAGALRLKQLADGTDAEIRRANRAWARGRQAIKDYQAVVAGVKPVAIKIDIAQPKTAIAALDELLGNIPKSKNVVVTVTKKGGLGSLLTIPGYNQDGTKDRDGDPATGKGRANGGLITGPGGPRDDLIPAMLSNREYVMSAAAVSHYGVGTFDAMNAKKLATGGSVSGVRGFIRNDLDMKYPSTLKQWNEALAASTKLLEKEKAQRQTLLDQAQGIRDATRSRYQSDLFGQAPTNVWMSNAERAKAGRGDVFSTLTGDINNLKALGLAETQLKAKGLDGAAFANLVSNGSLADVQAFAGASRADVMRYESLYKQREAAIVRYGNQGANAAYGPALAASKAQVAATAAFTKAIDRIDTRLEKVEKALHHAGPKRAGRGT